MKQAYSRWLLFGLLMLIAGWVHAENGCPPGFQPSGMAPSTQDPVACRPIQGSDQQQASPQPPRAIWISRWGAIATDAAKGSLGTAVNLQSKNEAERAALADCQSKGGLHCKLQIAYDSECAAMILGDKVFNVAADAPVDKAVQAGMASCSTANDHSCRVYYSACSLPVQIQ